MLLQLSGVVRLAAYPEQKFSQSGLSIVTFPAVSGEKYKDKEESCFIDCTVFGGLGEKVVMPFLKKGSQVYIRGKLKQDKWQDQQSGQNRSKHTLTVESLQLIDSKPKQEQQTYQRPEPQAYQPKPAPEIVIEDGELPF